MRKKEEPAQTLLTMVPAEETTLKRDGFLGALYKPDFDAYPGKVLILTGGSDGLYSLTKLIAEQFTAKGLTTLALAYWAKEGLPTALCHVPVEYAENAASWLKERGYEKIGMYGISMGAQYALLCSACFPELITCCVAVSPISYCTQAIAKRNPWHQKTELLEGSAFSYRKEDFPWQRLRFSKKQILMDSFHNREITLRSCYDLGISKGQPEAEIPVERIKAPLLLLAAERDSMWPSRESAERIQKRRAAHGMETEYVSYAYASHLLLPYELKSRKMFRMERQFPDECRKSSMDAFLKTLLFLKNSW